MNSIGASSGNNRIGPSSSHHSRDTKSATLKAFEELANKALKEGRQNDLDEFCDTLSHAAEQGNHSVKETFQLRLEVLKMSVARVCHSQTPVQPCIDSLCALDKDIQASHLLSMIEKKDFKEEINYLQSAFAVLKNPKKYLDNTDNAQTSPTSPQHLQQPNITFISPDDI